MKITLNKNEFLTNRVQLAVMPVTSSPAGTDKKKKQKDPLSALSAKSKTALQLLAKPQRQLVVKAMQRFEYKPASGKRLDVQLGANEPVLRLSGINEKSFDGSAALLNEWRKVGGDAFQAARNLRAKRIAIYLDIRGLEAQQLVIGAVTEGLLLASYEFTRYKKNSNGASTLQEVLFISKQLKQRTFASAVKDARLRADAVALARDLVNTPPNDLTPSLLVKAARTVVNKSKGKLKIRVYDQRNLVRLRAGALIAVGQGSDVSPFLIHLSLKPSAKGRNRKRIVLVGKGVTFDSGGLSIKPAKGMEDMKCDMAGAACVLAVMKALAALQGPATQHEIHALIPTAENMVNGGSVRPGDIVRALNGKTIEILNTDAEGRLILADALSFSSRLNPDLIIDLATLTGACVVALGTDYAGLFTADERLQKALDQAGTTSGENLWPLPLAKEYRVQLDSQVADLRNIGTGGPGATLGALFLQEFVPEKASWAHLDIAGPAFWTKGNEYTKPGGTGFGVRTLLCYLDSI